MTYQVSTPPPTTSASSCVVAWGPAAHTTKLKVLVSPRLGTAQDKATYSLGSR